MTQYYKVWRDSRGGYIYLQISNTGAAIYNLYPKAIEITVTEYNQKAVQ